MSQDIFNDIDPASTSGEELADLLNLFKDAIASGFKGTTRPANLQAGGIWVDNSLEASPNFTWYVKIWDGTNDIVLFTINISTNTISLAGTDNSFSVTKISADTAGAILTLAKQRIANSGQVLDGDVLAEIRYTGRDNAGSDHIAARIKAVASDNFTGSNAGAYLVFEATSDGNASIIEMMRLVDGKLGVGITAPLHTIHARGSTGIASDRLEDSSQGAKWVSKKKRVTGLGATQNSDVLSVHEFYSTDDTGAYLETAEISVQATQAHTSSAGGTSIAFKIAKTGSVALTTKMLMGDLLELKEGVQIEALILEQQDVGTATTIAALDASKSIVAFTGSTATSLQGISATGNAKVIVLHNKSTAVITVKHADTGASAANRFSLPNDRDITIDPRSSLEVFYSISESRWKIKSGSGSGSGGGYTVTDTEESVASGAAITTTVIDQTQLRFVKSAVSGGDVASNTPFGTGGGWIDGTKITLIGTSDADPLTINANDASNGAIGNFSTIVLTKGVVANFIRSNSRSRWYYAGGAGGI